MSSMESETGTFSSRKHSLDDDEGQRRGPRQKARRSKMRVPVVVQQGSSSGIQPSDLQLVAGHPNTDTGPPLTAEELAKKLKIREAARQRQAKHRAKKKEAEALGLSALPAPVQKPAASASVSRSTSVVQQQLNTAPPIPILPPVYNTPPPPQASSSIFAPGQIAGGQTFASTLLLSFSCSPLLKQHLLRTLAITNEELASLESVIADAYDQWDHTRRSRPSVNHSGSAGPTHQSTPAPSLPGPPMYPDSDFRARFHAPLVAPSPFTIDPNLQQPLPPPPPPPPLNYTGMTQMSVPMPPPPPGR